MKPPKDCEIRTSDAPLSCAEEDCLCYGCDHTKKCDGSPYAKRSVWNIFKCKVGILLKYGVWV